MRRLDVVRTALVGMVVALLAACGGGGSEEAPTEPVGSVTTALIRSAQTGYTYELQIYLPASYASGNTSYPVIYATDGDARYPPENRFINFKKILQRRGTNAILVGIGGTANRGNDFVLPGARLYHAFITQELIPFTEARFRADPARRMLSGLSLGGSFVATALFLEAPATLQFSHYISAEGSFWQQSFLDQEQQFSGTQGNKPVPATLILARSAWPNTNNLAVNALYHRMLARNYTGLGLVERAFEADHVGMDNPSFEDAVKMIFE
jgi:predicted alpha/beta superfamily hydrolase